MQWKQADYVGAFYITLWFCWVGQILLILGEKKKQKKKIVFENVMVCWHNTKPIFCVQACTLVYFHWFFIKHPKLGDTCKGGGLMQKMFIVKICFHPPRPHTHTHTHPHTHTHTPPPHTPPPPRTHTPLHPPPHTHTHKQSPRFGPFCHENYGSTT